MKNLLSIIFCISLIITSSGCASYFSYQASKEELLTKRAIVSNDEIAIKAIKMGNFVGLGINVTALEVVKQHPIRQFLAAAVDAGVAYGLAEGLQSLENHFVDGPQIHINNSSDIIVITADDGAHNNNTKKFNNQ